MPAGFSQLLTSARGFKSSPHILPLAGNYSLCQDIAAYSSTKQSCTLAHFGP